MRSRSVVVAIAGAVAGEFTLPDADNSLGGQRTRESSEPLAGDDLIAHADLTATRVITISASAAQIWPWIAQLGQGRGGFTTFSRIWAAATYTARIGSCPVPDVEVGDEVRLAPEVGLVVACRNLCDLSFSMAGFRLGPAHPRMTSPGRLRYELSRTVGGRGLGFSSSPSRWSAS